jgi:DNA-binding LacI/PurR family transcriptional regulator
MKDKKTIYTIAKALELSPGTISKVLNQNGNVSEHTRERVLKYIKEVGYVPAKSARNLKSKRTFTIGVVFTEALNIGLEHAFFSSLLQHFKSYVERFGYELSFIVRRLGGHEMSYLEWCMNKRVDGVYIVTGNDQDQGLIELIDSHIPSVSNDLIFEGLHSVVSDNAQGVYLALDYIKNDLKKDRVAYISGPLKAKQFQERYQAYQTYIKNEGWHQEKSSVVFTESFGDTSGYRAVLEMMALIKERPDVIFVASDDIALGVLKGLRDLKINVPEDIQIIGFDDMPFAKHFTPTLTTIAQDRLNLGEMAAKILISKIEQPDIKLDALTRIPVKLIVRESTQ